MKHTLRALALTLALLPALAAAQVPQFPQTLPANTVIGRLGVGPGPSQAIPFSALGISTLPQQANKVMAGPPSGVAATPGFRSLVGADLPTPAASSLGGVQSLTCSTSTWFRTLSISGVFGCSQPNFTDLAGTPGQVPIANGGTGQATALAARGSSGLNIDAQTSNGDSNVAIASTVRAIATSATFTAARTWTLPAANSVNAGQRLIVEDLVGAINGVNNLTVAPAGADTINGAASLLLSSANQGAELISDGSSKWMGFILSQTGSSGGQCLNYVAVGGDNTAALTAALTAAIAAGKTLCLPAGTIQISGNWPWPSNSRIRGAGRDITILQKTSASSGVTFISAIGSSGTHLHDIYAGDFTVDANSATVSSQFYSIATDFVDNFTLERTKWTHAYNGGHVFGSVTGGTPTTPNGWQTQTNFVFRDNIFDCAGGKVSPNSGDCTDILWTDGLLVENNVFQHSGVNGLSTEFNRHFLYINNRFIDTAWGLYGETSQDGAAIGNEVYSGGSGTTPAHNTSPIIGIWFADANQTYVGGGYGGSQRVKFIGNSIHNLATTNGASAINCIVINAPAGALAAQDILIDGNSCFQFSITSGVNAGVVLGGAMDTITVKNNTCRGFGGTTNICIVPTQSYTAPGMAAAQSSANMAWDNNLATSSITLQSPAPTCSSTGSGTGGTCAILAGSNDAYGVANITAGTTAAASGNVTVTLATAVGINATNCTCTLQNVTAGWTATSACLIAGASSTAPIFNWNNGGTGLTNAGQYGVNWSCKGR